MIAVGVVLAAGASRRMGRPKALLGWGNETFLGRAIRVLAEGGAERVVVVVGGPHRARVERAVRELAARAPVPVREVVNEAADEDPDAPGAGPVSSVRAALRKLLAEGEPVLDAVLIHPVDVPGVETADVAALLTRAEAHPAADAVVPSVDRRRGHPLLLRRGLAERLVGPDSPATVRDLLRAPEVTIEHVERTNRGLIEDFDTPADLAERREGRLEDR